jgi:hypothetical protein
MPENEDIKPVFWESEDGNFYPADPKKVLKCRVCENLYKVKTFPVEKNICSPGCSLKLTESKGQSNG